MKCAYCGKNNKEDAVLCKRCGVGLASGRHMPAADRSNAELSEPKKEKAALRAATEIVEAETPASAEVDASIDETEQKKKLSKKTIAILVAIGAAVIGIAALVLYLALQTGITLPKKNSYTVLQKQGGFVVVYKGDSVIYPDTSEMIIVETSLDRTEAGALTENGALYYFHDGDYNTVANNATWFTISANGRYIAYVDIDGRLWSYDGKNDSSPTSISEESVEQGFAISPDGNSLLFNKKNEGALYLCVKGKVTAVANELSPISVSKGGKYVYAYSNEDNAIYAIVNRGAARELRGGIGEHIWLNDDHTEIVFTSEASTGVVKTHISSNGGEPEEIHNSALAPVLTASTQIICETDGNFARSDIHTCPIDTFDDRFFVGCEGRGLVCYSKKNGPTVYDESAEFAVADDGYKSIYYVSAGSLRYAKIKELSNAKQLAADCAAVCISPNGKVAWYTDGDSELHYRKGDNDRTVMNNVVSFVVKKDGAALILSDGKLYYSKDGNPKRVKEFDSNANAVYTDMHRMYYYDTDRNSWCEIDKKGQIASFSD